MAEENFGELLSMLERRLGERGGNGSGATDVSETSDASDLIRCTTGCPSASAPMPRSASWR